MSFAPMDVMYDGIRIELTPRDQTQSWQVYWNDPRDQENGASPAHFMRQVTGTSDTTSRIVVDNRLGSDNPNYRRWRTDVQFYYALGRRSGDNDYPYAPSFNVINRLPVPVTFTVNVDNYDWDGSRPDHPAPEGLQDYVMPSVYSEDDMDRARCFYCIFPFVNPHANGTPFDLHVAVNNQNVYNERFERHWESTHAFGGVDTYKTLWWAPPSCRDFKYDAIISQPHQLQEFGYQQNGQNKTGHSVLICNKYEQRSASHEGYVNTTTTLLLLDGPKPSPV